VQRALDRSGWVRADSLWALALGAVIGLLLLHQFAAGGGRIPELSFGPLRLSVFGVLGALDVVFGIYLIRRWCERFDLEWQAFVAGLPWIVVIGYLVSHLVSVALYYPQDLLESWTLLDPRTRISSFGGVFGGALVAIYVFRRRGLPVWRYLDALAYGFVGGFVFGRAGCFAIHDHPGSASDFILAVPIEGVRRHDLGFYEMWLMLGLLGLLTVVARRRRPADGRVIALFAILYAPARFFLDSLRIGDATYAGLTPAQWLCLPSFAIGLWAWRQSRSRSPEPPAPPALGSR
jgi:phosphatidylglycerol:prolipoprotein diacylglycerol transferase